MIVRCFAVEQFNVITTEFQKKLINSAYESTFNARVGTYSIRTSNSCLTYLGECINDSDSDIL